MIHGIVFHLIHILIDFFIIVKYIYHYLWTVIRRVVLGPVDYVVASQYSWCKFRKVPFHLGVIVGEDLIPLTDVSNLILWCLRCGIRHISIYDINGFFKENVARLYESTAQKKEQFFKNSTFTYKITFNSNKKQLILGTQVTNGHKVESIIVDLLSREDGKNKIVQAARTVLACLRDSRISLCDFHASDFDVHIKSCINLPDPDLILCFGQISNVPDYFGQISSVRGYLPWHIRLSEILSLPTHNRVQFLPDNELLKFEEFCNALKKYDRCEQRFGK